MIVIRLSFTTSFPFKTFSTHTRRKTDVFDNFLRCEMRFWKTRFSWLTTCSVDGRPNHKNKPAFSIAKRRSDVMTRTRLRQTNWNGGWFYLISSTVNHFPCIRGVMLTVRVSWIYFHFGKQPVNLRRNGARYLYLSLFGKFTIACSPRWKLTKENWWTLKKL